MKHPALTSFLEDEVCREHTLYHCSFTVEAVGCYTVVSNVGCLVLQPAGSCCAPGWELRAPVPVDVGTKAGQAINCSRISHSL